MSPILHLGARTEKRLGVLLPLEMVGPVKVDEHYSVFDFISKLWVSTPVVGE